MASLSLFVFVDEVLVVLLVLLVLLVVLFVVA